MKYYSTQRPIAPGTYPVMDNNSVLRIENYDNRTFIKEIARDAWGYIEYEKALPADMVKNYELTGTDEDKEKICKLLCKVLQLTRGAADLQKLEFDADTEIVTAVFPKGTKKINVAADSGLAMIKDITTQLLR